MRPIRVWAELIERASVTPLDQDGVDETYLCKTSQMALRRCDDRLHHLSARDAKQSSRLGLLVRGDAKRLPACADLRNRRNRLECQRPRAPVPQLWPLLADAFVPRSKHLSALWQAVIVTGDNALPMATSRNSFSSHNHVAGGLSTWLISSSAAVVAETSIPRRNIVPTAAAACQMRRGIQCKLPSPSRSSR